MEFFQKAKYVRLRSRHGKYLWADDDKQSVSQRRDGAKQNAKWKVEVVEGSSLVRLKSCHDCYLTASNILFLLGMSGRKVLQTIPLEHDSLIGWEPTREGYRAKLKTQNGSYLRANPGLPPWGNSVTHDIPQRTATRDWILWEVEITEVFIPPRSDILKPVPPTTKSQSNSDDQLIYCIGDKNGLVEKDNASPTISLSNPDI